MKSEKDYLLRCLMTLAEVVVIVVTIVLLLTIAVGCGGGTGGCSDSVFERSFYARATCQPNQTLEITPELYICRCKGQTDAGVTDSK